MAGEIDFSYLLLSAGDSSFIRTAAIPLSEALAQSLAANERSGKLPDPTLMAGAGRPRADAGASVVIGVIAFVASWAASKFLDEVYALKFLPVIRDWLARADDAIDIRGKRKPPTFVFSLWYEDLGVVIVVAISAASYAALSAPLDRIDELHKQGLQWAVEHPGGGPVYLYAVNDGSVNLEPHSFRSVPQALDSLHT